MNDEHLQFLAAIVRDSDDAIIGKTLDGLITSWNAGAERIYGYTPEEAIGRTVAMLIPPDRDDELPAILGKLSQGEYIKHYDTLRVTKGGSLVNISVTISPICSATGNIIGASSIGRDITLQKVTENALRESEARLQNAIDLAQLMSYEWNLRTNTLSWDAGLKEIWDLSPETIEDTRNFMACVHPGDREYLQAKLDLIISDPTVYGHYNAEYRVIGQRNKRERWLAVQGKTCFEDNVAVSHFGVVQDITERKEAEETNKRLLAEIKHERMRQGIIMSSVPAIVWENWGKLGEVTEHIDFVSEYVETMLGYTAEEWLSTPNFWFQIIHPDDQARIRQLADERFAARRGGVLQFRWIKADGSIIWVESQAAIILDESGVPAGVRGVTVDITERKRADVQIQFQAQILDQVQAAIIATDMQGKVSHWNRHAEKLYGWKRQEALDQPILSLTIGPTDADLAREVMNRVTTDGCWEGEFTVQRKDGSIFPAYVVDTVIRDQAGSPIGVAGISVDITERKRVERELRLSDEILQRISSIVLVSDKGGQIVYASPSVKTVLGYEPQDMLGEGWWRVSRADSAEAQTERSHIRYSDRDESPTAEVSYERIIKGQDGALHSILWQDTVGPDGLIIGVGRDITQRKASEEALRASEEKFRAIFENTLDAMFISDNEGRYVDVNSAASRLAGLSKEEMIGHSLLKSQYWTSETDLENLQNQVVEQGAARGELQFVGTNEEIRDIEFSAKANFIPGFHLSVAHDITESRRGARALRESEIRYRNLVETSPDAITLTDLKGVIVVCNQQAVALHGYSSIEDMLGRNALEMLVPEDHQRAASAMANLVNLGTVRDLEYTSLRKDGTTFPSEINGSIILDAEGKPNGFMSILRDITDRKEAESALKESERVYKQIFEANRAVQLLIDPTTGSIVEANQAANDFYGYSLKELKGMNIVDINMAVSEAKAKEVLEQMSHESVTVVSKHTLASGELRTIEGNTGPIDIGGRRLVHEIITDITEREQAQEARTARDVAERANAAKSEFLSRMSHELRTPLNAILGFGQLLQTDSSTPEQHESVDYIVKAGQHLLNLINEVLDIARIEDGKLTISMEPVFVRDVLRESLDLVQPLAARRNIDLTVDMDWMDSCYVMADRQRLQQVLLNLIANAIKYSREDGVVNISCTEWSYEGDGAAELAMRHQDSQPSQSPIRDKIRIAVSDTGPGLSPDKVAKLFTPFERLGAERGEVEGTGLGLALSKHLIEAMGGAIGGESKQGVGSFFWVELSAADEYTPGLELAAKEPMFNIGAGEQSRTVLYIEDNVSNLRLIERVVRHRPEYKLVTAIQGQVGLEMAYESRPDLILLDLHLPDMTGAEVLHRLREDPKTASIPVVVLSADANPRHVDNLLNAGAQAYLTKPLNVADLLKVLDETPSLGSTG